MGKNKYRYHPDDEDTDYCMGNRYQGRVVRTILTCNDHPRAIEVAFADGRHTIVHRRSFEVSETAIDFYPVGTSITLKKVGYMADRRTTKWVIMRPLKYDLYDPDGIRSLMESKRMKGGETRHTRGLPPQCGHIKKSLIRIMKKIFVALLLLVSTSVSAVDFYSVGSNAKFCVYNFDGMYYLILSFEDNNDYRLTYNTIVEFKLKDGTILVLSGNDGSKDTRSQMIHWGFGVMSGDSSEKHYAILNITSDQVAVGTGT